MDQFTRVSRAAIEPCENCEGLREFELDAAAFCDIKEMKEFHVMWNVICDNLLWNDNFSHKLLK